MFDLIGVGDCVELISSDNYFFDKDKLPELKDEYKIKQPESLKLITHHYELYESMNWDLLIKDLENILNTSNKKVLILEGFLILKNSPFCDKNYLQEWEYHIYEEEVIIVDIIDGEKIYKIRWKDDEFKELCLKLGYGSS